MRLLLLVIVGLMNTQIHALPLSLEEKRLLDNSEQCLVVTTPKMAEFRGQLQRFEREHRNQPWKKVGSAIAVNIGSNGLAFASEKIEGDKKTPMGVYAIGALFGFDPIPSLKNYRRISQSTVCVDDQQSRYYNQIIDSQQVSGIDWRSAESMSQIAEYQLGAMIEYNSKPAVPGRGSCIFMHNWVDPHKGTFGCIDMNPANMKAIVDWLKFKQKPVIAVFTADQNPLNFK